MSNLNNNNPLVIALREEDSLEESYLYFWDADELGPEIMATMDGRFTLADLEKIVAVFKALETDRKEK